MNLKKFVQTDNRTEGIAVCKNQAPHFHLSFDTDCFMSLGALNCFSLDRGCTFEVNAAIISAYSALIHKHWSGVGSA